MRRADIGVFLPVGKNGFLRSANAVAYAPDYRENFEITQIAEEIGLDYAFSMSKWRGVGGQTGYWDASLESFSLMSALAAVTTRITLIATVNPLLFHPVLMAKMAATIDDVSKGRLGLNIITGATIGEYSQMGVIPSGYDERRYTYASEWVRLLKRLWAESRVTHRGEFFELEDCVCEPKPIQRPRPFLVCAASSEEGLRFTALEADCGFITGKTLEDLREKVRRTHLIAQQENRIVKTAVPQMLVIADTKVDAEAYWEHLLDGADTDAITNSGLIHTSQNRVSSRAQGASYLAGQRRIYSGQPCIGAPEDIARALIELVIEGGVDSILLSFPDYVEGLRRFGTQVMPLLREALDVGPREAS